MSIPTRACGVMLVALFLVCPGLQAKLEPAQVEETLNKLKTALVQRGGAGASHYFGMELPDGVRRWEPKELTLREEDLLFMVIASSATNVSVKPQLETSSIGETRREAFEVGFEGVAYSNQMDLYVGEVDGEAVILGWGIRRKPGVR